MPKFAPADFARKELQLCALAPGGGVSSALAIELARGFARSPLSPTPAPTVVVALGRSLSLHLAGAGARGQGSFKLATTLAAPWKRRPGGAADGGDGVRVPPGRGRGAGPHACQTFDWMSV